MHFVGRSTRYTSSSTSKNALRVQEPFSRRHAMQAQPLHAHVDHDRCTRSVQAAVHRLGGARTGGARLPPQPPTTPPASTLQRSADNSPLYGLAAGSPWGGASPRGAWSREFSARRATTSPGVAPPTPSSPPRATSSAANCACCGVSRCARSRAVQYHRVGSNCTM